MILTLGLVLVGGFLGGVSRYLISRWTAVRWGAAFPWGTMLVNTVASFLLGLLVRMLPPVPAQAVLAAGFLGSLSTFSSFSWETLALLERGRARAGLGNVLLNVGGATAAFWLGWTVLGGGGP